LHRNIFRNLGGHMVRHSLGAMGDLAYFNIDKFIQDCEMERAAQTSGLAVPSEPLPLGLPSDPEAFEGIREMALMGGNPRQTDHCLRNIQSFTQWEEEAWPALQAQAQAESSDPA
jgi:trimethylamine--corrinoid protein Co-methyltransferase